MSTTVQLIKRTAIDLIPEVLIIFCLIFTINNYIGNVDKTIKADAIGYYEYLPSLFIHKDLIRNDLPFSSNPSKYSRIKNFEHSFYNPYGDYMVNKYPCGTALLQSPFFLSTYLFSEKNVTGYEEQFHRSIFYATLFYLFLGLLFFRKTLSLYGINRWVILYIQLLLVLATPVTHFSNFDAGFSHVYSFFAISLFAYSCRSFFKHKSNGHFLLASLSLGLVFLLRNPNIIVVAALPILAGSWITFLSGLQHLWSNKKTLIIGAIICVLIATIQLITWYLQTGSFIVYSYQGEGFNFLKPHFIEILFSYQKGLFIYTPVLFFSMITVLYLFFSGFRFIALNWILFFLLLTYLFSSWWAWHYGASFGMRVYIDFFVFLFLPLALFFNASLKRKWIKPVLIILCSAAIPVNIIQTYQYKEYILHWDSMDKERYWKVFLKTDPIYRGLVWRDQIDDSNYQVNKEVTIPQFTLPPNSDTLIYQDVLTNLDLDAIRFVQEQVFDSNDKSKIEVIINQDDSLVGYLNTYFLHFEKEGFNKRHTGLYDMRIAETPIKTSLSISILVKNENEERKAFEKIKMKFYSRKNSR